MRNAREACCRERCRDRNLPILPFLGWLFAPGPSDRPAGWHRANQWRSQIFCDPLMQLPLRACRGFELDQLAEASWVRPQAPRLDRVADWRAPTPGRVGGEVLARAMTASTWLSSQALNSARYPALASGEGTGAGTAANSAAAAPSIAPLPPPATSCKAPSASPPPGRWRSISLMPNGSTPRRISGPPGRAPARTGRGA